MNLGLPGSLQLTDMIADELGYDSEIFSRFASVSELAEFYVVERAPLDSSGVGWT
jgi:hypothetical protein